MLQETINVGVAPGPALADVTDVDTAVQGTLHVFTAKTPDHVKLSALALCGAARSESGEANAEASAAFRASLKQHVGGLQDAQLIRVRFVFDREPALQLDGDSFLRHPRNRFHGVHTSFVEQENGRNLVRVTADSGRALFLAVQDEMQGRGFPPVRVSDPASELSLGLSVAREGLLSRSNVALPMVRDDLLPEIAKNVRIVRHETGWRKVFDPSHTRP